MIFTHDAKSKNKSGEFQFWTHVNHAIAPLKTDMIESTIKFIHENPVREGIMDGKESKNNLNFL